MSFPTPNHDESQVASDYPYIGNFHKTLPHNDYGEVDPAAYRRFKGTCLEIEAGAPVNFEQVPPGPLHPPFAAGADAAATRSGAAFTSPMAGAATESHGPDPKDLEMAPAPGILSASTAAEMTELYWMALLRDVPLLAFEPPSAAAPCSTVDAADRALVAAAETELHQVFGKALSADAEVAGGLRLGLDLPQEAVKQNGWVCGQQLNLDLSTLFRSGLHDEEFGPLVSQFFIRPIPYGTQTIDQRQVPYIMGKNFLTGHNDWLRAQNAGKDRFGRGYGVCNFQGDQLAGREVYYPKVTRHLSTLRDLARFVNRDALHQAYFNAALFLDAISAPLDNGNPYKGNLYTREGGFATLGGPDLLTLVSEVASRALKVVWRQKWLVHRRCRPEVYGGLAQMQFIGRRDDATDKRNYGLPGWVGSTAAAGRVRAQNAVQNAGDETLFLPMAFSAGSPAHPAYGAGHATVAGACVTVLKAWFDEDAPLGAVIARDQADSRRKDPGGLAGLLQPGARTAGEDFCEPQPYAGADAHKMTVGGELNKIASNVAMGRTMGGVHWRSDNTRSLRLGEQVALEILRKRTLEYAERPVSFTLRSFDRQMLRITEGQVRPL